MVRLILLLLCGCHCAARVDADKVVEVLAEHERRRQARYEMWRRDDPEEHVEERKPDATTLTLRAWMRAEDIVPEGLEAS